MPWHDAAAHSAYFTEARNSKLSAISSVSASIWAQAVRDFSCFHSGANSIECDDPVLSGVDRALCMLHRKSQPSADLSPWVSLAAVRIVAESWPGNVGRSHRYAQSKVR